MKKAHFQERKWTLFGTGSGTRTRTARRPTDFTYHYSFHCLAGYAMVADPFVVWTMPLPYPDEVGT